MVQDAQKPSLWGYGFMKEWRWIDEQRGEWEGLIDFGGDGEAWIPGCQLKRVGS